MAGSRPSNPTATSNKTEMTTLPSGASYPTFLEPLTKNETALLSMYEKIKHYEKEASRLKAEEAKARLEEADERYRAKVRERERAEGNGSDDEEDDKMDEDKKPQSKQMDDNGEDDEFDESDEDEETIERRKKTALEISRLRKDVNAARDVENRKEAKKEAAMEKEEAMRRALLGEDGASSNQKRPLGIGSDDDEDDENDYLDEENSGFAGTGISMKRKKPKESNPWDENKPQPSLIANIGGDVTPTHDFSKKLGMSKISLDGSVLFPYDGVLPWEPPTRPSDFLDGCLELELPDFDSSSHSGNNTIAIKFHAPQESKRFSINIAAPNHDNYNDILMHFNPRHFKKGGQLVINDRKETMWGNDIPVPLSTLPLMFGVQACTLVVQITEEGFDVFVEGQHCARLEHRTTLPKGKGPLFLQFPSSDDYGNPENWLVYRVWWGRKQSMADDLNGVAGVNLYSAVHPKKLFISGLSKIHSEPEVDLRRAELERAFRKYGGRSGAVNVSIQKNSTFAFVELFSEELADLALAEMANKYKLNRARRTKHEALMEKRAAEEALEKGTGKENAEWD
mmetsp:Transcript_34904/g.64062  ORF Transcript_34904/g.64062 Transcript_34904/m.64062 type:complete len:568 (-) Transcript_34904:69-1772(-)